MANNNLVRTLVILFFLFITAFVDAQQGVSFDLPKPKKFENRKLASEKSGDKKFTVPRKFMQNTTTHYNYFFNANEKLQEVITRAKADYRDDYTHLLSFYNYGFDQTARYKTELDSVIYKSTAGILLHDLRSNWVDNLYLLIGQAYYLKKDFDSAYLTFQYLNYAFSPKEKDGYDKVIGSNANEGGSAFSISTNEKRNVVQKAFTRPASRNESLVWQIKTYIANDELPEAAGFIQTLKYDPLFPARLKTDLDEAQAWYFYKQNAYDSAALYLELALDNAANKQETARWEYLIAQLYEKAGKNDLAQKFYDRVIKHTIDPVLEVYALLNSIRQSKGDDDKAIQNAIHELVKMGRKDKYVNYRDIIYFTAAEIELDNKKNDSAKMFLLRSIKNSVSNPQQKSKSFYSLANIEFEQKDFINAKNHYDSVVDVSILAREDMIVFQNRKDALTGIVMQLNIINRQDSLQKIAAMPEAERTALLKKLLRKLRKQQGLKEEDTNFGNTPAFVNNNNNTAPTDLFNSTDAKGDWYFTNTAAKSKGFGDFKAKWGNRANVDNWQRSSAIKQQLPPGKNGADPNQPLTDAQTNDANQPLSLETLLSNIPVTPEKIKISNDSIMHAQFELGKALQDELEDYSAAIDVYEKSLQQFPNSPVEEQTLFNLYYCYKKIGDTQKMAQVKRTMEARFGNNKLTSIVKNPLAVDDLNKKSGAQLYDEVYNLFIEGKFEEALNKKHKADTLYGKHYWSPQLLYIEAVYHINQRNDSTAKLVLDNIVSLYPGTPMAAKAQNLAEVLGRRKQIEDYLTKLQVELPKEDSTGTIDSNKTIMPSPVAQNNNPQSIQQKPIDPKVIKPNSDTLKVIKKPVAVSSSFINAPDQPHYVVLVMDKVDPVYVNEAKNAFNRYNKEKYYNKAITITPLPLTDDIRFILLSPFDNALDAYNYLDKARKIAASEIIPWMPAAKYSFIIITESNLETLKNNKDVPAYKKFIGSNFPGIF